MNNTLQQDMQHMEQFYIQKDSVAFFAHIEGILQTLHAQHRLDAWVTLMLQKASLYMHLSNESLASHTLADVAAVIEESRTVQKIDYYTTLAALQQATGSHDEAFNSLHVAEALALQEVEHYQLHRIYFYKSFHYAKLADFSTSLYYAKLASSEAPHDAHMTLNVAHALVMLQQLEEADTALHTIAHIAHTTPYVYVKAQWLITMQRHRDAELLLRQQLKQEAIVTWQLRLYELLCPLVKQLHTPRMYVEDLRAYFTLMERTAQEDRNTKVAAISHYFDDEHIQSAAWIDPLTRVYNRKYLEDHIEAWTSQHPTFAIAMCDIDTFKQINDTYGHLVGDEAIQLLAHTMKKTLPHTTVIRYGGDEFIVLWTTNEEARIKADLQLLQQAIAQLALNVEDARLCFTISIGVDLLAVATNELRPLLKRADEALYTAKANGRNQYVIV